MCGIAGIWDFNNSTSRNILIQEVTAMADRLQSRGPDSSGYWVDEEKGIAFSHRRLAIQDLSRNGNQPFFSNMIVTEITKADTFYKAEEYHQKYIQKKSNT